jgi:hypothetical protein
MNATIRKGFEILERLALLSAHENMGAIRPDIQLAHYQFSEGLAQMEKRRRQQKRKRK